MPPIRVTPDDARAIAEYIHSVTATMRGQGNPPPGPAPVLNVLVGDAAAGEAYFKAQCGTCHSATGDLQGIGSRLADPTALQNYWISAGGGLARGGRGGRGRPMPVTVTPATGQKVEGTLVRLDDFYVVVELADGTQRTFRRDGDHPVVDVRDPLEPHSQVAPGVHRQGYSQRDGISGDAEMKKPFVLAAAPRAAADLAERPVAKRRRPRSRSHQQAAVRFVAGLFRRLHRSPFQRAEAGRSQHRQEPRAGVGRAPHRGQRRRPSAGTRWRPGGGGRRIRQARR